MIRRRRIVPRARTQTLNKTNHLQAAILPSLLLLLALGFSWSAPLAQSEQSQFASLHPRFAFRERSKAGLVLPNKHQAAVSARVVGFDTGARSLGEVSTGPPLGIGEWRVYPRTDGTFPQRAIALRGQFDGSLPRQAVPVFRDGRGRRDPLAGTALAQDSTFLRVERGKPRWPRLNLVQTANTGNTHDTGNQQERSSESQAERVRAAVERALASLPPGGYQAIPHGTRILEVKVEGARITLNLSKELLAVSEEALLEDAVHQILARVSDAVPELKDVEYRILVEGVPYERYLNR